MARHKKGRDIDGVVLLDKPLGCSSNAALQRVRRAFEARKGGHTGSLDPLASGLLPICLGEATKLSSYLLHADKQYRVTAAHGFETETGDREGKPTRRATAGLPTADEIQATLACFMGAQSQVPPMYSALKQQGKRLYELARSGETVARAPRAIIVSELRLVERTAETFTLHARVSSGTYIRTLVEDIAAHWGGRAHVASLRRTNVGDLGTTHPMVPLARIERCAEAGESLEAFLWPVSMLIQDWPHVLLDLSAVEDIRHGRTTRAANFGPGSERLLRLVGEQGELLGLGQIDAYGRVVPKRLFVRPQF